MLLPICAMLLLASDLGFCLDEGLLDAQWEQWKITHGKDYNNRRATREKRSYRSSLQQPSQDEDEYRKFIWKKNMHLIEVHNQEAALGKHSYTLGMNYLGDQTLKEMTEQMMCLRPTAHIKLDYYKDRTTGSFCKSKAYSQEATQDCPQQCMKDYKYTVYNTTCSSKALPKSIDYREKGMVTGVKDQKSCGSCWAFSAVGALEGQLAKKKDRLLDLSPQNLVDCDQESNGCSGGHMVNAFKHVQENGGIHSEKDYPYVSEKQPCRHKPSATAAQCKGFKEIPKGDECALAEGLCDVGPLSVAIDASHLEFQLYNKGVYYNPQCDENNTSHAMLLVGYAETAKGEEHWIVKNSYGTNWGVEGYIHIARNRDNHCGIATDASYPLM